MRHYQRGIGTVIILVLFLIIGVAVVSGALIFYQNLPIKPSANSFEECAKLYPVMESYPEQCSTPDGKHFFKVLSEEEKQRLVPPTESSPNIATSSGRLLEFKDAKLGFSINYPNYLEVETREKYSFMTTKNSPSVSFSKTDYVDYLNLFSIEIIVDDNPEGLSAKALMDRYVESLKKSQGPEAKFVVEKVNKTRHPYQRGDLKGEYSLFGWDYDYDVIVLTENGKIYTILYTGNNGSKITELSEEEVNKMLSTLKFIN